MNKTNVNGVTEIALILESLIVKSNDHGEAVEIYSYQHDYGISIYFEKLLYPRRHLFCAKTFIKMIHSLSSIKRVMKNAIMLTSLREVQQLPPTIFPL